MISIIYEYCKDTNIDKYFEILDQRQLGLQKLILKSNSLVNKIYSKVEIKERYRTNVKINKELDQILEKANYKVADTMMKVLGLWKIKTILGY